jgi:chorismate dehydratase
MASHTQQQINIPNVASRRLMTDLPTTRSVVAESDRSESIGAESAETEPETRKSIALTQSQNAIRKLAGKRPTATLRIGAVAYLNTKPLIYGLEAAAADFGSLQLALPSRLATALHHDDLDIGLIPVVEYLRHRSTYRIVSNAAIACRGPVWSVRVLFRKEPRDVRTLAVDEGSRSSVALTSILYQSRFGRIPELVEFPIDARPEDSNADAVLVIGDRAMRPERYQATFLTDWDLGEEWHLETGLPFVFALWTARDPSFVTPELAQMFEVCRDQGCRNVEAIINEYSADYGLTHQQCRDYLTRYLRFHFMSDEQAGLAEFLARCESAGLV